MIDRIGGIPLAAVRTATSASTMAATPAAAVAVKPDLSTLAATTRDLAKAPPVDTAKVDRIKSALALGTYKIDPAAVAEKMIALDLPHRA